VARPAAGRAAAILRRAAPAAVLGLILAGAALLRFWDLAANPGGLYGDEAAEGLDAWRMLHQPGFRPDFLVWFTDDGGREALFAYVVSGAFWLFGSSALVLRGVAAAFGVAGVAAVWWLARRFGTWTALAAAAWAAGSLWLVCVSRDGMRNAIVPFFGAVALAAFLRWSDRPGRRAALLAGAVTALAALYTYQPLKLLPVLAALWWLWLRYADRPAYERLRPGMPPFCAAFLAVAAPMLAVAATNPANYFGRIAATSPFNPAMESDAGIFEHTLRTIGMFGFTGDPNARHDVAQMPLLSIPLALIALAGVVRLWRMRREPAGSLILLALPVFLLPPLAAVDGGSPHFLRALGLAAPLGVTVGLGAAEFADAARGSALVGRLGRPLAIGLVAALLAMTAAWSGLAYFSRPVTDRYQAFSYPLTEMAAYAAERPGSAAILDEHSGYVVEFLNADEGTAVYRPGVRVPSPTAHPVFLALSAEDFRAALGDAAVERAVPVAWDPWGQPVVWVTTP
jgi:4-amino-4-deoxy-L-arabinose transferase-like glycosyltransferase